MSARWSNHFYKFSKTDWWCHLIQMFYLNSIFSWLWSFFFCIDCWTVHQHQIHCAKNVAQVSRKWNRKKFINQKPYFVFKKCRQFFVNISLYAFNQHGHFRQFIQNMTFDSGLFGQASQFFFIRGIHINRLSKFQSLRLAYDLLLAIVRVEVSLPIPFILWISEHSTQLSLFAIYFSYLFVFVNHKFDYFMINELFDFSFLICDRPDFVITWYVDH